MDAVSDRDMELTLPLVPDIEVAAAEAAGELAKALGMMPDEVDEIAHAVIEACINVREHAACDDERIYLRFTGSVSKDGPQLDIWVTDRGRGFDPEEVRRRQASRPDGPRKRGWGLQIIGAHMDEVDIDSGSSGTTLHMVKKGRSQGS
ncbi:MAG: ATP-binding protein [Thermoanaerobaculia bacterium]|nr:ATP-binding protein [Thermoanaerobaculia bacterium]